MASSPPPAAPARIARALATVFGLGHLPLAPGTWGSLAGLPLWWWGAGLAWPGRVALAVGVTVVAVVVAEVAERSYGSHDVQAIVIDEVAGMAWTSLGGPFRPLEVAVGFVLFRLLDALKPPPVGLIDRRVGGGLGVVLDDVAAGLMAAGILSVARRGLAA